MEQQYDSELLTAPHSRSLSHSESPFFTSHNPQLPSLPAGLSHPHRTFTQDPPVLHARHQSPRPQACDSHRHHEPEISQTRLSPAYRKDTRTEYQADDDRQSLIPPVATHTTASKSIRQRASRACESCRTLKAKCDEENPCKTCQDKNQSCEYRVAPLTAREKEKQEIVHVIKSTLQPYEEKFTATLRELRSGIKELQGGSRAMQGPPELEHGTQEDAIAVTPSNPGRSPLLATTIVCTSSGTAISTTATPEKAKTSKRAASPDCRHVKRAKLDWKKDLEADIACLRNDLRSVAAECITIKSTIHRLDRWMVELREDFQAGFGELKEYLK